MRLFCQVLLCCVVGGLMVCGGLVVICVLGRVCLLAVLLARCAVYVLEVLRLVVVGTFVACCVCFVLWW